MFFWEIAVFMLGWIPKVWPQKTEATIFDLPYLPCVQKKTALKCAKNHANWFGCFEDAGSSGLGFWAIMYACINLVTVRLRLLYVLPDRTGLQYKIMAAPMDATKTNNKATAKATQEKASSNNSRIICFCHRKSYSEGRVNKFWLFARIKLAIY